jgi:hypothetical protein
MYILQTKKLFTINTWMDLNQSENLDELVEKVENLVSNGSSPNNIQIVKKIDLKITTTTTVEKGE